MLWDPCAGMLMSAASACTEKIVMVHTGLSVSKGLPEIKRRRLWVYIKRHVGNMITIIHWLQNQYEKIFFLNRKSHSPVERWVKIVRICFLTPAVQVIWVGMLSLCLQFPITINLISSNQELTPLHLHICDAQPTSLFLAPHGSAVYHWFLICCYAPAHPLSPLFACSCQGKVCWWSQDRLAKGGGGGGVCLPGHSLAGVRRRRRKALLSAPVWATWTARWASAGQTLHSSAEQDYDNVKAQFRMRVKR